MCGIRAGVGWDLAPGAPVGPVLATAPRQILGALNRPRHISRPIPPETLEPVWPSGTFRLQQNLEIRF